MQLSRVRFLLVTSLAVSLAWAHFCSQSGSDSFSALHQGGVIIASDVTQNEKNLFVPSPEAPWVSVELYVQPSLNFDNGLDAQGSGGTLAPSTVEAAEVVAGISGQAVRVGAQKGGAGSLAKSEYDVAGLFSNHGTVMFWIKSEEIRNESRGDWFRGDWNHVAVVWNEGGWCKVFFNGLPYTQPLGFNGKLLTNL